MKTFMKLETLRDYMSKKKGAYEDFPFGPQAMVFKVMGKMFALVGLGDTPLRLNLKCDPELALHLREVYDAVLPGYHMNKRHWNTVILNGTIPYEEVCSLIDDSYDLVVKTLNKVERQKLMDLEDP
jgi:predicted DNA-binding protein (MmcQ/YjbR family)